MRSPLTLPCPYCGFAEAEISGAASDGDGDLYDEYFCPDCGECFPGRKSWYDDAGHRFDSQEEMIAYGVFDED